MNSTEYIINQRIKQYEHDIQSLIEDEANNEKPKHIDRIMQDKVIIQELRKILLGTELDWLSYVDKEETK